MAPAPGGLPQVGGVQRWHGLFGLSSSLPGKLTGQSTV